MKTIKTDTTTQSNANLIAAAPELLGILKEVLEIAYADGYINLALGKKIEAAIDKAEGK